MRPGRRGRALPVAAWLVATSVAAACASPVPSGQPRPTTTLEYASGLTADLYLPDRHRSTTDVPVVVLVPGGGWATADPSGLAGLAAYLADRGIAAAPAHVRAGEDGVVLPVPVDDVLCAVASVVATVGSAGVEPGPVVVLGHSSGAQLAALAALAVADFTPRCRAPLVAPDALVGLSGPYDIARVPDLAVTLLGSTPEEDPEAWAAANPVERADLRRGLPVLLVHGADDDLVPVDFTTQFADALDRAGHPTTVDVVPGAGHDDVYGAGVAGRPVVRWVRALLHRQLAVRDRDLRRHRSLDGRADGEDAVGVLGRHVLR